MTVEALRRGEPEVLAELLEEHGSEIQGVAYLILRDRQLEADRILLVHEVGATSVDPGLPTQLTLGPIELEEGFGISLVCSGPGEITITEIALDGSREPQTYGCLTASFPQGYEAPNVSRDALVQVSVEFDPSTAWRLIVYDPPPSSPRR